MRTWLMSARQSPPIAIATARSAMILPGSWVANGLRHRPSAVDNAVVRPVFSAVRSTTVAPAYDTTPVPEPSTDNNGYRDVDRNGAPRSGPIDTFASPIIPGQGTILHSRHEISVKARG